MNNPFREIKYAWQRVRRGWSDSDAYNMDVYLASIIHQMLQQKLANDYAYPAMFVGIDEWRDVLIEMIDGFEAELKMINMDYDAADGVEYEQLLARFNRGMDLLQTYYGSLWS